MPENNLLTSFFKGRYWKEQRRCILRNLRDFGFGKASIEHILTEEYEKLVEHLKPKAGQVIDLRRVTNISILNSLWNILTGEKVGLDDHKLDTLINAFDDLLRLGGGPTSLVALCIPNPDILLWPGKFTKE